MPAHLDALAEATARGFADAYGRDCEGVWSAPGRLNLIGEHTDYNEGFVLPFAIGARTAVAASRRKDGLLTLVSAQFPGKIRHIRLAKIRPGTVGGWPAYPAGVAWALGLAGPDAAAGTGGASLYINSVVPTGSGLSSSAALDCAVALQRRQLLNPEDAVELIDFVLVAHGA